MERLTHEADFGLEDWEETLFFVKSDPNGAYNIIDIAKYQGEPEFDEILKNVALRLAAYEDTGLEPEEIIELKARMEGLENGQDEPIEKCKACPLCCSDKQRHYTPPNEPLTIEQLREMDGEPVWFDTIKRWGIVKVNREGIFVVTKSGEYEFGRCKVYRRPPEGEANA